MDAFDGLDEQKFLNLRVPISLLGLHRHNRETSFMAVPECEHLCASEDGETANTEQCTSKKSMSLTAPRRRCLKILGNKDEASDFFSISACFVMMRLTLFVGEQRFLGFRNSCQVLASVQYLKTQVISLT